MVYISCDNIDKAKKIYSDLQQRNANECYICPILMFEHLTDMSSSSLLELRKDFLCLCDTIVTTQEINPTNTLELNFAKKVNMEVVTLES